MAEEVKTEKYDLVIFGATGFTGQFVVEEVARTIEEEGGLTWAIAGRSMEKLQQVLREASKNTGKDLEELPIIIADVSVESTLNDMCKQAKVLLNCVGPYRFYGRQVVQACIENGTHHLDISGEPGFLEKMQILYSAKAKETGSYIIGSCGFDSIPCDMGVLYTSKKFDGDLNHVEGFLAIKSGPEGGCAHYATWQSAIHGFATLRETISQRKTLFATLPPIPKPKHKMPKRRPIWFSEDVNSWCLPFPGSDKSVVYRTQRFLFEDKKRRAVQFNPYMRLPSWFTCMLVAFVGTVFGLLANFRCGRWLLETFPRFFSLGVFSHAGPTRKQIEGSSLSYTFVGHGYPSKVENPEEEHTDEPNKKLVTRISAPEAGYVTTPICLVQAAYVVLKEQDKLPKGGGVLTPGGAFDQTRLIERLEKHDVKFQVVEN